MAMEEVSQPEKVLKQSGMIPQVWFFSSAAKWAKEALSSPPAACSCPGAALLIMTKQHFVQPCSDWHLGAHHS